MALVFHRVVSVDEALRLVEEKVGLKPLGVEKVPLQESLGRILAEDVYARVDSPPFDRSRVDGYAVAAEDTYGADEGNPVELKIAGKAEVGKLPEVEAGNGLCIEIATGAPLPRGANAVVMVEYTKREGDRVLIYRAASPGENVAQTGSDATAGDVILRRGRKIGAREMAALAAIGVGEVEVYRRPRAAVFSTGDELTPPSYPLEPGKVYDVNGYAITSMLRELGVEADFLGILPDDYESVLKAVKKAVQEHDLVITSGSTSAGFGDVVYSVFAELGGVLIHGLRLKPGKPTVIGASEVGRLLIGLPGFPLSAMMVFMVVVRPLLKKLMGARGWEEEMRVKARIPVRLEAGKGRRHLIPVQLLESGRGLAAYPLLTDSGAATALSLADGFLDIPEEKQFLEEDEEVEVTLLQPLLVPSVSIIGSHCPALDLLVETAGLWDAKHVNVGSLAGWRALKRGEADVAGTHLLDPETMTYNLHMPGKLGLEDVVEIYRGYVREIGLVVARGNPKKIQGIRDLLRDDVIFVNRVKGSGIRVYVDAKLRELGVMEPERRIRGYTYEAKTHTAVAAAVAQGRADVGVAVGYVAKIYGLDFIPLSKENFDIAVRRERLNKPGVRRLLGTLKSPEFREKLSQLPHYSPAPDTGSKIYG